MFHQFHPSQISLASQRLKKLKSKAAFEVASHPKCGFDLELVTQKKRFMDLKISVSPELEQDDFLLGFFLAERELMRGRQLLELTTLSFREWESFFRDLNHQLCVSEGEFLRCEKLHEELMNALVEEIFNHAWERATTDLGPLPQEKWIEALAWVSEVLEKFFDHLSSADRGFELLSWRSEGNFPQEMILTIGHAPGLKLSQAVLERMKIFLQRALPETKEIKLVAE